MGKYMIRPLLSLERLSLLDGKVAYRTCPRCGGAMKVVSFLTEPAVVDRIIDHLQLTFAAEKPPPEAVLQELLWEADPPAGFFSDPPVEFFP